MDDRRSTSRHPALMRLCCLLLVAALASACEMTSLSVAEVSDVEVHPPLITLLEGSRESVSAVLRESGGAELSNRSVAWTTDDPEVATVSPDAVVEGRAAGSTRIRATSEGVTGVAEVRVLRAPDDPGPDPDPGGPGPDPGNETCQIRDHTFDDDFEIPRNTSCAFTNVHVRGKLVLREGARLVATDLRVDESLEADHADGLSLTEAQIGGDVKFQKGGGVTIIASFIGGVLELKQNQGSLEVRDNTIEKDVKLERNRGGLTLVRNTIDGTLECKDNDPPPTGSGNLADEMKGQCSGL